MKLPIEPNTIRFCPSCGEFYEANETACFTCLGDTVMVEGVSFEGNKLKVAWVSTTTNPENLVCYDFEYDDSKGD